MSDPKFYCRAEDLAIGYGKTPLMEHIGLGVGKGSILTLIGPNGAGKSTLLKTLAAQLAPGALSCWTAKSRGLLRHGARPQNGPDGASHPPHRADHLLRDGVRRALPYTGGWASSRRKISARSMPRWPSWGPRRWRAGTSTASATASASASCWPGPSASSRS